MFCASIGNLRILHFSFITWVLEQLYCEEQSDEAIQKKSVVTNEKHSDKAIQKLVRRH